MHGVATNQLRSIAEIAPEPLADIDRALAGIAAQHGVTVVHAIESGSRAWGFPSPDSDFDCRFLFVRRADDYLSPWSRRDVIELPLEGELDVNGWDLGKALKLLLKGNAVVIEWLTSPIVYKAEQQLRDELLGFAYAHADRTGIARHYLHLGVKQRRTYFASGRDVQLKKLFYALRPAAALRWLRLHPERGIPPMHFPTLMAECDAPAEVQEITADLIASKAVTRELGSAPLPRAIEQFVDDEFGLAAETLPPRSPPVAPQARDAAEQLFRRAVQLFA